MQILSSGPAMSAGPFLVGSVNAASGLDSKLVDGPVGQRRRQRVVDEPVLVDERQAVEAAARHDDLEVVAAARPVEDGELARIRKGRAEELLQPLAHAPKIPAGRGAKDG